MPLSRSQFLTYLKRATRDGVTFWALTSGKSGKLFLDIKKRRNLEEIEKSGVMRSAMRFFAEFAKHYGFELITTPPSSGKGVDFAGAVAERIAERAGIPYRRVFKDHSRGKRLFLGAKFQEIETDFLEEIRGAKVLVFDDFAYTRFTMIKTLAVLRAAGNEAEGVVLLAS